MENTKERTAILAILLAIFTYSCTADIRTSYLRKNEKDMKLEVKGKALLEKVKIAHGVKT